MVKTIIYATSSKILDTACPPASPEGEADGGQAETSIQHLIHNRSTMCYPYFCHKKHKNNY
jgi:hypothetical protein